MARGSVSVIIGNNFVTGATIELEEVAAPGPKTLVTGATITAKKITFTWPLLSATGQYKLTVTLPDGQKVETTVDAT
jgi:hypothetical protein